MTDLLMAWLIWRNREFLLGSSSCAFQTLSLRPWDRSRGNRKADPGPFEMAFHPPIRATNSVISVERKGPRVVSLRGPSHVLDANPHSAPSGRLRPPFVSIGAGHRPAAARRSVRARPHAVV